MARNQYPGYCYCCGKYVPPGYGHFERHRNGNSKWRIKCVKCASGRTVTDDDPCVKAIKRKNEQEEKKRNEHGTTAQTQNGAR